MLTKTSVFRRGGSPHLPLQSPQPLVLPLPALPLELQHFLQSSEDGTVFLGPPLNQTGSEKDFLQQHGCLVRSATCSCATLLVTTRLSSRSTLACSSASSCSKPANRSWVAPVRACCSTIWACQRNVCLYYPGISWQPAPPLTAVFRHLNISCFVAVELFFRSDHDMLKFSD